MTHKEQIIIDGVDVDSCKYYLRNVHKSCGVGLVDCEGKDCIFKQLAHKTQECVKLNNEIIDMNSIIEDAVINLGNKDFTLYDLPFEIKKLWQECEALKSESFTREELITLQEKDIVRYCKALEEIEKIVNEPCVADAQEDCKHCDNWCEHKDILDIINKAKGEE